MNSPVDAVIKHKRVGYPLACSYGKGLERAVIGRDLKEKLEPGARINYAACCMEKLTPAAFAKLLGMVNDAFSFHPPAAVRWDVQIAAHSAALSTRVPQNERKPARHAVYFVPVGRVSIVAHPIVRACRQSRQPDVALLFLHVSAIPKATHQPFSVVESASWGFVI